MTDYMRMYGPPSEKPAATEAHRLDRIRLLAAMGSEPSSWEDILQRARISTA